MSLTSALSTAITGLTTAQQRLALTSSNISNVNTKGYSRKIAGQETVLLDGVGSGSRLSDVHRNVDRNLLKQLREEKGDLGRDQARQELYKQMQQAFGAPKDSTSVAARLTKLANSWDALAANPKQNATRLEAVSRAGSVIRTLDDMTDQIQKLRGSADAKIKSAVDEVNTSLERIQQLNADIVRLNHSGLATTELEDKRDMELEKIAAHINIQTFTRSDGDVVIYTGNGTRTLLDRAVTRLSFSPSSNHTAGSGADSIKLGGIDITKEISTGSLNALTEIRDKELPQMQDQFDKLAKTLRDEVNAIHNRGTSFPPPENLYSSRRVSAGDRFTGHGIVRVAAVDAEGNLKAYRDLDLSEISTISGVITELNKVPGLKAQIVNGQLQIEAEDGQRVSINEMDSAVALKDAGKLTSKAQTDSTGALGVAGTLSVSLNGIGKQDITYAKGDSLDDIRDKINTAFAPASPARIVRNKLVIEHPNGDPATFSDTGLLAAEIGLSFDKKPQGFSHYLGFNNFFQTAHTGDSLYSAPQSDITKPVGLSGTLRLNGNDISYSDTDTLEDIARKISAHSALDASVSKDGGRYRLLVTSGSGADLFHNDTGGLAAKLGLSADGPGLAGKIEINPQITDNAQRIAYAELNADTYESAAGSASETTPLTIAGTTLGTGTLSIRGSFGTVNIGYDGADPGASSLQDIANRINADTNLTNANVSAEVEFNSAKGGYVLRITDKDGDPIRITDSNTGANGLLKLTGLDTRTGVQSGDNTIAKALAARFDDTDIAFGKVGGLGNETTSFNNFAASILSANATLASDAQTDFDFQKNLVSNLQTRTRNVSGVNLDEEMADMIVFQKAYSSSARVITSVNQMFDELLKIV